MITNSCDITNSWSMIVSVEINALTCGFSMWGTSATSAGYQEPLLSSKYEHIISFLYPYPFFPQLIHWTYQLRYVLDCYFVTLSILPTMYSISSKLLQVLYKYRVDSPNVSTKSSGLLQVMGPVRGYSLYLILGMLSLCLLHIYSTCCTYAAYPILHFSSPHCPSS